MEYSKKLPSKESARRTRSRLGGALWGIGVLPNKQKSGSFLAGENRPICRKGTRRHRMLVQCLCQQRTGTAADHIRTGLRKGSACLNMDISRGLKVAQLLAGFPDGITLYVDRPFIPREYQCFSWLGTAPSVYLCNLRACWLLHRDESVPIIEGGMEVDTVPVAGIDVSKRFSDLCILSPENQVFSATRIYHDKTSMDRARDLLLKAQAEFGHAPVIVMESTSHYHLVLYQYFTKAGFEVLVINPLQSHALRNMNIRRIKNDRVDAKRLALLYRTTVLRPSLIPQDVVRGLRILCRQRSELLRDSTRYKNHLTALLDQIFPGFDRVFSKVSGKGSLAALSLCPTPQAVLSTELERLAEVISEASRKPKAYGVEKAQKIRDAALHASMIGIVSSGDAAAVATATAMLKAVQQTLDSLEEEIKSLAAKNAEIMKNVELLSSIPGIGFWISMVLVSEIGDFSAFHHPKQLAAYIGLDPSERQSGTFHGTRNKMSKRGSPHARAMLHMAVHNSVYSSKGRPPHNPVLAEYYARKCLSKPIKVAMGAAMHKLCNIIFAVLRNQKPFELRQPELHAASLGIKVA